jgi:hypothetical protein
VTFMVIATLENKLWKCISINILIYQIPNGTTNLLHHLVLRVFIPLCFKKLKSLGIAIFTAM